ncbi:hypothetical protein PTKIN_Ptkin12aG0089700 [Pterospermum kingtungense]
MSTPNNKMKGLLKGLRYISQIFDNEKEPEMQIGFPTDVKHVAHIGWDGPSVNSAPNWMNEFKSPSGHSSSPLANGGEVKEEDHVKWVSQDGKGSRHQSCASSRDMPELPKSSKHSLLPNRNGTGTGMGIGESSMKERLDKHKQSRKPSQNSSSKDSSDNPKPRKSKDPNQPIDSTSQNPSTSQPKRSSRRKKSKESSAKGSLTWNRTEVLEGERLSTASGFEEGEGI